MRRLWRRAGPAVLQAFAVELLRLRLPFLQVADEAFLVESVQILLDVLEAGQFLEVADAPVHVQAHYHPAHIKYYRLYHNAFHFFMVCKDTDFPVSGKYRFFPLRVGRTIGF